MENQVDRAHSKSQRREARLQRVELQQTPHLAAQRVRQGHVHRLGHGGAAKSRPLLRLAPVVRGWKRWRPVQLRAHGDRTLRVRLQNIDGEEQTHGFLQWR